MKILYNYTTRSRPELFKRGLASIIDNSESTDYRIQVSIDEDDPTMNNEAMWINMENTPRVTMKVGKSKNKIDAINRDVNSCLYDWGLIVNQSDDMIFTKKGFDDIIRWAFLKEEGAIDLDQCLHFSDGNRNDLITMAIMGREYYDRFGYIYHPDYKSLWCDNEMTEVAKQLGCYKFIDVDILKHLHPAYAQNNATFDKQYQHTESFSRVDEETFKRRSAINFDLNIDSL